MSKTLTNLFFIKSQLKNKLFKNSKVLLSYNENFSFEEMLKDFKIGKHSNIFIHAGLKNIKQVTNLSYNLITQKIVDNLQKIYNPIAIMAPTFTPSFRKSGVYSKLYSKAEYGVFSELFRQISVFRTDDAIHSIGIISSNLEQFKNLNYRDSFAEDGFFGQFHKDTYILNINTEYFVSTYMHYVEEIMNVPYKDKKKAVFKGVIFNEKNELSEITQINHFYKYNTAINREKINNLLLKNNVIKYKTYNKIVVSCVNVKDLVDLLKNEIKQNPYYMVVF